ncbi:hypothetical protein GOBAR_DD16860 [Gossypium barbadense]|nr:hypothetical protein GOBAR_DD16860 [Gossypium barbadense]
MADEAKAKGNAAFSSGDFNAAIKHFTDAINLSPTNHVLYSNRSAAYASLHQYEAALSDAKRTVELKPDWSKGYSRLGAAHLGLHQYQDAVSAYKKGLEIDPNNEALKSGLADAQSAATASASRSRAAPPPNPFGDAFQGPEMWAKLTADPTTRVFLQQPDFVKAMQEIQRNPSKLNEYLQDQRVMQALGVLLNVKFKAHGGGDDMEIPEADSPPAPSPSRPAKEEKKDFETAIKHYTTAMELDEGDISYITNRAAVYLEMGKVCAVLGVANEPAIETFQKALTEHRNPDTLKKLNDAEKAKKDLEQQEYYDPKIADEEREKGNECFKQQKYPEAVKHYTESLRRNPKDPKAYSNRAACYTKLGALPEGLKDAEKCIELDPTFSKGYTRKGAVQFFMKEYDKALETYQEGLKHDANNQELLDGVRRCVEQINKANRGDLSPEELKERQAKAMQDPEIQNILSDPVMRQVLIDFQENPKAAQEHMKNPMVMNKIQKLVSAGINQQKADIN